jgi:hypothetical protein
MLSIIAIREIFGTISRTKSAASDGSRSLCNSGQAAASNVACPQAARLAKKGAAEVGGIIRNWLIRMPARRIRSSASSMI